MCSLQRSTCILAVRASSRQRCKQLYLATWSSRATWSRWLCRGGIRAWHRSHAPIGTGSPHWHVHHHRLHVLTLHLSPLWAGHALHWHLSISHGIRKLRAGCLQVLCLGASDCNIIITHNQPSTPPPICVRCGPAEISKRQKVDEMHAPSLYLKPQQHPKRAPHLVRPSQRFSRFFQPLQPAQSCDHIKRGYAQGAASQGVITCESRFSPHGSSVNTLSIPPRHLQIPNFSLPKECHPH